MCENDKQEKTCEEKSNNPEKEISDSEKQKRSYYYDDAHGYEIFEAEIEEESDEN